MSRQITEQELCEEKYAKHYDKNVAYRLLKKLRLKTRDKPKLLAKSTGIVLNGLGHLLSALENPELPLKEKAKIIGAIGYIILPVDLIPDAIPVFGFADDATALKFVLDSVRPYSTFSMEELDAEIDGEEYISEDTETQLPAVVESEIAEIDRNPDAVEEPELEPNGNLSLDAMMAGIEKSNELFQKFLDKNSELDNDFNAQQEEGEKKSNDMWDAISRL